MNAVWYSRMLWIVWIFSYKRMAGYLNVSHVKFLGADLCLQAAFLNTQQQQQERGILSPTWPLFLSFLCQTLWMQHTGADPSSTSRATLLFFRKINENSVMACKLYACMKQVNNRAQSVWSGAFCVGVLDWTDCMQVLNLFSHMRTHLYVCACKCCVTVRTLYVLSGKCVCEHFWAGWDRIPTTVRQGKQVSLQKSVACYLWTYVWLNTLALT